jgi:predicted nucleotidyltransferase
MEPYRAQLTHLCREFRVARLDLVGSGAAGDFDPSRSDLDFLVTWEGGTPLEQFDRFLALRQTLTDLFQRSVDLLEAGGVTNPIVRRTMDAQRVTLYAA